MTDEHTQKFEDDALDSVYGVFQADDQQSDQQSDQENK